MRKILLATDFSDGSAAAERMAVELASKLGASILALHVVEPPPYSYPSVSLYVPSPELVGDALRAAKQALQQVEERLRKQGIAVESAVLQGVPYTEIVRVADEGRFDLVVIGTHGRTGLKHFLLGSVAERVVRSCTRPVLTMRGTA